MLAHALVAIALITAGAPPVPAAAIPEKPAVESKGRKIKMAVLDCRAVGAADPKTIEGLSSLIVTTAASRPELQVIGSSDMRALIGFDRERALLGCTESSCLAEIGGALGVDYLVSSEGAKVGSSWLLTLTLLDTAKSVAVKRLTKRTTSDDQLIDVAVQGVHELLGAVPGLSPAPVPVATVDASPAPQENEEPEAEAPGYRTHDGFYLRLDLGGGGLSSRGSNVSMAGPSGSFSLALGYSLGSHLIVYGAAFSSSDTSPTVTTDGEKRDTTGLGVTHSLTALGVGAAWYFTGSNIFVAGTVGGGSVSLEFDGKTFETNDGPVLRFDVGKEWWVSTNWGLGVALHLTQGFTPDSDEAKSVIRSTAYGLSFSATYN